VDSIVLSHLHADHMLDLVPYGSALLYGPHRADTTPHPVLHAPPGGREAFARVSAGAGMTETHVSDAFRLREYDPRKALELGDLRARFQFVPHFVPAYAVELTDGDGDGDGGGRLTFSADCGPNDALPAFAQGTDLLLIEATITEEAARTEAAEAGLRGHLTAREAGEHGRRAGAARLVLTHISDELDLDAARADAAAAFGADVEIAAEHDVYTV
jgi:ribonuclease BN (tRNA processing enzyme)